MVSSLRVLVVLAATVVLPGIVAVHAGSHRSADLTKQLAGDKFLGIDLRKPLSLRATADKLEFKTTVADDTIVVTLHPSDKEFHEGGLMEARFHFANGSAAAVDAIFRSRASGPSWLAEADDAGVHPVDFEGWSSRLGGVYATQARGLYLSIATTPRPNSLYQPVITVHRILRAEGWAAAADDWTPYTGVASQVEGALERGDFATAHVLLQDWDRPLLGQGAALFERVASESTLTEFPRIEDRARAAQTWSECVAVIREIKAEFVRMQQRRAMEDQLPPAERHPTDSARVRRDLERIFDLALPRIQGGLGVYDFVRDRALARVFDEVRSADAAQRLADTYMPFVENQSSVAAAHGVLFNADLLFNAPIGWMGAKWNNTKTRDDQVVLRLAVEALDMSDVRDEVAEQHSRAGAWIPATEEQLAEQRKNDARRGDVADAPARIATIDAQLAALASSPAGAEVKGAAAERQTEIVVGAGGNTHEIVTSESPQNTYRVGVARDLKQRAATRERLLEERRRLQSLVSGGVPDQGRVVNGMVWSGSAGEVLTTSGHRFVGRARRGLVLTGDGIDARHDQVAGLSVFYRDGDPEGNIDALSRRVEAALNTNESFGFRNSLAVNYRSVLREAISQIIEREVAKVSSHDPEAVEADRVWALSLFDIVPRPSEELIYFILGWKPLGAR